jgi:hypothetical protein
LLIKAIKKDPIMNSPKFYEPRLKDHSYMGQRILIAALKGCFIILLKMTINCPDANKPKAALDWS